MNAALLEDLHDDVVDNFDFFDRRALDSCYVTQFYIDYGRFAEKFSKHIDGLGSDFRSFFNGLQDDLSFYYSCHPSFNKEAREWGERAAKKVLSLLKG